MVQSVQQTIATSEAIDGTQLSGAKYRLFGNFWLDEPKDCLSENSLARLRELEPHFRELEARLALDQGKFPIYHGYSLSHANLVQSNSKQAAFNVSQEFARFQEIESLLWSPLRRKDELVPPSGDFNWPIAHHLHNPSFVTQYPHNGETADPTTPCIALIMANTFLNGKTLIFDHLARREITDGLVDYPAHILACHEDWLLKIRKSIEAKVEILYGRAIQQRMLKIYNLERLCLWGNHSDITIYLEWASDDLGAHAVL
jgi:hypothetical protein